MAFKSVLSLKSIQSMDSKNDRDEDIEEGMVFEKILVQACNAFLCPKPILVKKEHQRDDYKIMKHSSSMKYKKSNITPSAMLGDKKRCDKMSAETPVCEHKEDTVVVTAVYDDLNRLVEIQMHNVPTVPRVAMKVIALLAPYYPELAKISIKADIDMYTIYELSKILPLTYITDICLDDSPLPEANYAILLDNQSRLKNLSLCRCRINDEVCKLLAAKLSYLAPAENNLLLLNLSTNHITNAGAKCIGEAMRTNRHLRYLNLSDNHITDEGADYILLVLTEFPLTADEIVQKRRRYIDYLKTRRSIYLKHLNEDNSPDEYSQQTKRKSLTKKNITTTMTAFTKNKVSNMQSKNNKSMKSKVLDDAFLYARAEFIALEILGPFDHPFGPGCIVVKNDFVFCKGNLVLCYLNLAYNSLSYLSVKRLLAVLLYQNAIKTPSKTGLVKVTIEGNCMPTTCSELDAINELIHKNISRCKMDAHVERKKSRAARTADK